MSVLEVKYPLNAYLFLMDLSFFDIFSIALYQISLRLLVLQQLQLQQYPTQVCYFPFPLEV